MRSFLFLSILFVFSLLVRIQHIPGPLRWEERDIVPALRDISISQDGIHIPPKAGDHTPLPALLAWPLYRAAPHSPWMLRIPSVLFGAVIPLLLAIGVGKSTNPVAGLFAGLLAASNNFLISWSAYFVQEMSFLLFTMLGFLFLGKAQKCETVGNALLSALFLGLAFWSHEFAFIIAPMIGLYLILDNSSRKWLSTPTPWAAAAFWGLLITPYFVWNLLARGEFIAHGGMSIAQQHISSTVLAQRGLNLGFLRFYIGSGFGDLVSNWPNFELNHVDPIAGMLLLASALISLIPRFRPTRIVKLSLVVFWSTVLIFSVFDLKFRIYRFSLTLLPACVMAGILLERLFASRSKLLRACVVLFLSYAVIVGTLGRPYAAGAAHRGFRWWGHGPLFSENPLLDTLRKAQKARKAGLVILPAAFWDHVPLRAEYETDVRYVGGSKETIYSSTYWMRPYERNEASRLRVALSRPEDISSWWEWLSRTGYEAEIIKHDITFRGIHDDTSFVCSIFFLEAENADPPPVSSILDKIYSD